MTAKHPLTERDIEREIESLVDATRKRLREISRLPVPERQKVLSHLVSAYQAAKQRVTQRHHDDIAGFSFKETTLVTALQKLFVGKSVPTGLWWDRHFPVLLGSGTLYDGSRTAVLPFEVENFRAWMEKQGVTQLGGLISSEGQTTYKEMPRQKLLAACHAAIDLLEHEREGLVGLSPSATKLHVQLCDAVTATEAREPV